MAVCPQGTPFTLLSNKIGIDLMIGNTGPHRFILDTGASMTYADKSLQSKIGAGPWEFSFAGEKIRIAEI